MPIAFGSCSFVGLRHEREARAGIERRVRHRLRPERDAGDRDHPKPRILPARRARRWPRRAGDTRRRAGRARARDAAARSHQSVVAKHRVHAEHAVDELRHAQVDDDARERKRLAPVEPDARARADRACRRSPSTRPQSRSSSKPNVSHAPSIRAHGHSSSGRRAGRASAARASGHSIAVPLTSPSPCARARRRPRTAHRRPGSAGRASSPRRAPCSRCSRPAAAAGRRVHAAARRAASHHAEERREHGRGGPRAVPTPSASSQRTRKRGVAEASRPSGPGDDLVDLHDERLALVRAAHLDRAGERMPVVLRRRRRLELRPVVERTSRRSASRSDRVTGVDRRAPVRGRARSARAASAARAAARGSRQRVDGGDDALDRRHVRVLDRPVRIRDVVARSRGAPGLAGRRSRARRSARRARRRSPRCAAPRARSRRGRSSPPTRGSCRSSSGRSERMSTISHDTSTRVGRLLAHRHHRAVRDQRHVAPLARDARLAERHDVLALGHLAARRAVHELRLEDRRRDRDRGSPRRAVPSRRPASTGSRP